MSSLCQWKVYNLLRVEKEADLERLLLNHTKTPGFLAPRGEFNPGQETRLDRSELLCNKVLLKYKGDRESSLQASEGGRKSTPLLALAMKLYTLQSKECLEVVKTSPDLLPSFTF